MTIEDKTIEPDFLDRAANLTREMADAAISDVRHRARPEQVQRRDGSWPHVDCVICAEPLPAARLKMARVRCVVCQTRVEMMVGR